MSGRPFLTLVEARAWVAERIVEPAVAGKVRVVRRFDEGLGEAVEALAEVGPVTVLVEATKILTVALGRGEVVATGTNAATGADENIPAPFWERAVVDTTGMRPGRPGGRAIRRDNGSEPWREIRIDRRQLEQVWPGPAVPGRNEKLTIRAERDCEALLIKLAEDGPPGPSKAEARESADQKCLGLSARGFERAWRKVAGLPGNGWMARPGRRPRQ